MHDRPENEQTKEEGEIDEFQSGQRSREDLEAGNAHVGSSNDMSQAIADDGKIKGTEGVLGCAAPSEEKESVAGEGKKAKSSKRKRAANDEDIQWLGDKVSSRSLFIHKSLNVSFRELRTSLRRS